MTYALWHAALIALLLMSSGQEAEAGEKPNGEPTSDSPQQGERRPTADATRTLRRRMAELTTGNRTEQLAGGHGQRAASEDTVEESVESDQRTETTATDRTSRQVLGQGVPQGSQVGLINLPPEIPWRNATFRKRGSYSPGREWAHLATMFNLETPVIEASKLTAIIDSFRMRLLTGNKLGNHLESVVNSSCDGFYTMISEAMKDGEFACEVAKCSVTYERSRFATEMLQPKNRFGFDSWMFGRKTRGLAEAVAVGLSLFNVFDTYKLKQDVFENRETEEKISHALLAESKVVAETKRHVHSVEDHIKRLDAVTSEEQIQLQIAEMSYYVTVITGMWRRWLLAIESTMISGKLSPQLMDLSTFKSALAALTEKAKKKRMQPVLSTLPALLREETSFVAENGKLYVILHLPLAREELLDLYELVKTPYSWQHGLSARLVFNQDYLAISKDEREFREISRIEIGECEQRPGLTLCESGLTERNPLLSCLGSLYFGRADLAGHFCHFEEVKELRETLVQIGDQRVLVYSPPELRTSVVVICEGKKPMTEIIQGHSILEVPRGCAISTPNYRFKPEAHFVINETFISRQIEGLSLFFNNMTKLPAFVPAEWKESTNWKDLMALQTPMKLHSSTNSILIIAVFLFVLIALSIISGAALCLWRHTRSLRKASKRLGKLELKELLPLIGSSRADPLSAFDAFDEFESKIVNSEKTFPNNLWQKTLRRTESAQARIVPQDNPLAEKTDALRAFDSCSLGRAASVRAAASSDAGSGSSASLSSGAASGGH